MVVKKKDFEMWSRIGKLFINNWHDHGWELGLGRVR